MKKAAIFLCVSILSMSAFSQNVPDVIELLDNERYSSAEEILEQKINKEGPDPNLNYLLVKTYLEQDKTNEAKKLVEQYHLNNPGEDTDPLNRVAYGGYLLGIGDKVAAAALFEQILDKKNKKNPALLMTVAEANILSDNGDVNKALEWLEMAEKKDKHNPEIDILRGNAYRRLADANNAYMAYRAALVKDPRNVKAHYQLGRIFTTQKNDEVYLDHFMKAYAIDSAYAPVLKELYDHYYFKDVKRARKFLEKYIVHSDHSLQNDYRMTDMLYLTGDYEKAIQGAKMILEKEKEKAQPRLYKLVAYSYSELRDSINAIKHLDMYFAGEEPSKLIARDFEFKAELTSKHGGGELKAIEYYNKAFELDSVTDNKVKYATQIAGLYKKLSDYSNQAKWLGYIYDNKESKSNVDLFNWGLAHYNAREYPVADSVFGEYILKYPDNIYGYYWRAQVNAAVDTSLTEGLAIPHYLKVVEVGEKDKETNKKLLAKAYGYLGGYEANTKKDYPASLAWFVKFLEIDPANADALRYKEILEKWIAEAK